MNFDRRKNLGYATIPNELELDRQHEQRIREKKFRGRDKNMQQCFHSTTSPYADRFSLLDEPKQLKKKL